MLLLDQDRARWDQLLIRRGLAALARAEALGGALRALRAAGRDRRLPRARARRADETDWPRIAALYDALAQRRAVAGRRAEPRGGGRDGVRARRRAWSSSTRCAPSRALARLPPAAGVRGDLLAKLGRQAEARAEFERAAELTRNAASGSCCSRGPRQRLIPQAPTALGDMGIATGLLLNRE